MRWLLLLLVLAAAAGFRLADPGRRVMHADEGNQAYTVGRLLEGQGYAFDPRDHHGPTLHYLGAACAWLRGERTFAALTEASLRLGPALAGVVAVLLLWLLARPLGEWPALGAAAFLALAPAAVYYSRYFIQESLMVAFTLGALAAGVRWWRGGGRVWAVVAGVCVGLMLATKATAPLLLAAIVAAVVLAGRGPELVARLRRDAAGIGIALGCALLVAAAFYSSFGSHAAGLRDALDSYGLILGRVAGGATGHEKPWWYYAGLFVFSAQGGYVWDQTLFLLVAVAGFVSAWIPRTAGVAANPRWERFFAAWAALLVLLFSVPAYKTPWMVVNLLPGLCLLAAIALGRLRPAAGGPLAAAVLLLLGWQAWQGAFFRPADPRNPLAYVHTSPDLRRLAELAALAPAGPVKVISREHWPAPWYLRARPDVGYWAEPPSDCDGALVIASADLAEDVQARLRGKYTTRFLGLRPGFVFVVFSPTP